MEECIQNIKELFESESFGKEIDGIDTAEGLQAAFKEHGVDITPEEIDSLCDQIVLPDRAELDESYLESVSGGGIFTGLLLYGGAMVVSYAAGRVLTSIAIKKTGACKKP